MGGMSSGFSSNAAPQAATLRESEDVVSEIFTSTLGFRPLNSGEAKIKLIQQPWPADSQPPAYANLLAVASAHGLFVAGAPSSLVVGKTAHVRDALYASTKGLIRDCQVTNAIPLNRPTHVAFASDEMCLVAADEHSSEVIAYQTADLTATSPRIALRLPTRSPVRALAPNPDPAQASLFAILNTNGELLLANLEKNELISGANGPVLAEHVSCVTWSLKGKQMMVGKMDGSAIQLKPDGTIVAVVGKPTSVPDGCHLAHIVWLENDVFMFIYTSSTVDAEDPNTMDSYSYLVRTDKGRSEYEFKKFDTEPFYPDTPRGPAHFFSTRIRNYGPDLGELLIFATTMANEAKIVTKVSKSLTTDGDGVDTYTLTTVVEDTGLVLPTFPYLTSDNPSCLGIAIDLSDPDPYTLPLPMDLTLESSHTALPELMSLGTNGLIAMWAVVYEDAVRSKTSYAGFGDMEKIAANSKRIRETMQVEPRPAPTRLTSEPNPLSTGFQPSSLKTSNTSQPMDTSNQMTDPIAPAFGQSTPIGGETKSSWISTGFGAGSTTSSSASAQAPAFGSTPALGSNARPAFGPSATPSAGAAFGQSGFGQKSGPAFGQTGLGQPAFGGQSSQASPFTKAASKTGGFSAFASNAGGFAAANKPASGSSGFATFGSGSGFGDAKTSRPFAAISSSGTSFGQSTGIGKSSLKIESTFQPDKTSKDGADSAGDSGAGFGFGGFGGMLGGTIPKPIESPSKELDMEDNDDDDVDDQSSAEEEILQPVRETPPSTISQTKTTPTPHVNSLFGQTSTTPQTEPHSKPGTGFSFGDFPSTTPKNLPTSSAPIWGTKPVSKETPAAVQKSEPAAAFSFQNISRQLSDSDRVKSLSDDDDDEPESTKIPAAPLPPDPFSKPAFQTGDTSVSSLNSKGSKDTEEPPLPPDFLPANRSASNLKSQGSEIPSELLSQSDDDSGEDISDDLSPVEGTGSDQGEQTENVETSPESSFGRVSDHSPIASPTGGPFTKVSKVEQSKTARPLFGELGQTGPILPPPQPKPQESPRSPSPMRKPSKQGLLARSPERSFSAPARPRSILEQRKTEFKQSTFAAQATRAREEEIEQERARNEAARKSREAAAAAEIEPLIDDEDLILQQELAKPTEPSENLDPFVTIQPGKAMLDLDGGRTDIPSQIEKLYQDINSMIVTLGINAKSLSAYMMYQAGQKPSQHWPSVLNSDTPADALNDEWFLGDTDSLPKGVTALEVELKTFEIKDVVKKLEDCQDLLTREVTDLRSRITSLRRATQAQSRPENNIHAPLSAEQVSLQQDLRKSSTSVLNSLNEVEENMAVLKARLADNAPSSLAAEKQSMFGFGSSAPRKPTFEAVMTTVQKLTSMAEKKSADIDVLEAQMKKLKLPVDEVRPRTPERRVTRRTPSTPGSGASSVFYTPGSKGSRSVRTTPSRNEQPLVSTEDKQKWQVKAKRRKDVANTLRSVLMEKHSRP